MQYYRHALAWIAVVSALLFAGTLSAAPGYARPELLIETEALARILGQPNVRLIDAVETASYQRAHIPGAVNIFYLDLAKLEERKKNGHPLSNAEAERIFGDAGIDSGTQVIVYDDGTGPSASGVWFVLDFFGHKNVKVLNGGFRKWLKEGRPVTQEVTTVEKKRFHAKEHPEKVVTREWVQKNLRSKDVVVVDTRSFNEFIGKDLRPGAQRGGHLPGAVHLEWTKFSDKVEYLQAGRADREGAGPARHHQEHARSSPTADRPRALDRHGAGHEAHRLRQRGRVHRLVGGVVRRSAPADREIK